MATKMKYWIDTTYGKLRYAPRGLTAAFRDAKAMSANGHYASVFRVTDGYKIVEFHDGMVS